MTKTELSRKEAKWKTDAQFESVDVDTVLSDNHNPSILQMRRLGWERRWTGPC
jgi:hypothetical protein